MPTHGPSATSPHGRAVGPTLKRPFDADPYAPSEESFARRRGRRKPRGRLRADELIPDRDTEAPVPEIVSMLERGYLEAIEGELKSGKEATVYVGRTRVGLAAVKVYRDLAVRSFKNDGRYRAGRFVGDARIEKAMAQCSAAGRRAQARMWAAHEYAMLWRLRDAGVPVPEPLVGLHASDIGDAAEVALMPFVGDEAGPAPRLSDVRLAPQDARRAFDFAVAALTRTRTGRSAGDPSQRLGGEKPRIAVGDPRGTQRVDAPIQRSPGGSTMPRHHSVGLLAAGLTLLLAACATTPSSELQAWTGTSTAGADTYPLTIDATLSPAGAWAGTYTVERTPPFTGDIAGTLVAGVLEGELTVSDACRFELVGTVTGDALDATFAPTDCPGGSGGTWSATRTTPTLSAGPPTGPTDGATFDGDATFNAATFR